VNARAGFWLNHFGAYLQTERVLSDLFTVIAVVGALAVLLILLLSDRPSRRALVATAAVTVALLVAIGGGYAVIGAQFRASCLRADDALAATLPVYPGAKLTTVADWPDYNNGDGPRQHNLSFTYLFPVAWNDARRLRYSLPMGTTGDQVLGFFAPRFFGWQTAPPGARLPAFFWRGRQAIEIRFVGDAATAITGYELVVSGWSRSSRF
jgi:hypothetical protein